jgi:hypothetical protein
MNHENLPPYAFVPGGPWPHPSGSPEGHSFGLLEAAATAIEGDDWRRSTVYLRGVALFNAGYYWEAHEAWESLWHAHGRKGPTADVLKGLIKLAAAGVKVRERQPHGIATHARRAAALFEAVRSGDTPRLLGLDLAALQLQAADIAETAPVDPEPPGTRVSIVFGFRLEPD